MSGAGRRRDRGRSAHRARRHLRGAGPAPADGARAVARAPDRARPAGGVAPLERLRRGVAARRARGAHDARLRAEQPRVARRADARLHRALSRRAHGDRRPRAAASRWRSARLAPRAGELRRETWYSIHLYAYLAVALSFAHQLAVGTDFSGDRVARALVGRALRRRCSGRCSCGASAGRCVFNARHELPRARASRREAPGVVSIYLSGRRLDELDAAVRAVLPVALPHPRPVVEGAPVLAVGGADEARACASR